LLAVLASTPLDLARADDAPTSSVPASAPSCDVGESPSTSTLAPELLARSRAVFMKLCSETGGAIVNGGDARLKNSLTLPTKPNRSTANFYPHEELQNNHQGAVFIAIVVETDGRISWAAVLKSSGYKALDDAALRWASGTSFKSPGALDSKPVRVYMVMSLTFGIGPSMPGPSFRLPG
jgi:TonB family protein